MTERIPKHWGLWLLLAIVLKENGQLVEAEDAFRRSLALLPNVAETWLQLGHLHKRQFRIAEAEYAFMRSLRLDPTRATALAELIALGCSTADIVGGAGLRTLKPVEFDPKIAELRTDASAIVLDLSDLLQFLQYSRTPTGIQRVVLSIIQPWLNAPPRDVRLVFAALISSTGEWRGVSDKMLSALCRLSIEVEHFSDREWQLQLSHFLLAWSNGPLVKLQRGMTILNLGSPVGVPNYYQHIRNAKREYDVRYFQFIHDCIPLLFPEYFVDDHGPAFRDAMIQTLHLADGHLVNSLSTADDLKNFSHSLGFADIQSTVIYLDGPLGSQTATGHSGPIARRISKIVRNRRPYVLFVSTIEPRKNHLLALHTWLEFLKAPNGDLPLPRLICVGRWGWKYAAVNDFLRANPALNFHVRFISGVSDPELSALYRHCRFVIYPSSYEGWGLPVTEALQHNKLPLVARSSSLPEAGGKFAEYFEPDDPIDFKAKLLRLIQQPDFVAEREREIAAEYRSRSWTDIGAQILSTIAIGSKELGASRPAVATVEYGKFYSLALERSPRLPGELAPGSMFRSGSWYPPDNVGTKISHDGRSELRMRAPAATGKTTLMLKMMRVGDFANEAVRVEIDVDDEDRWQGEFPTPQSRWICLPLSPSAESNEVMVAFKVFTLEEGGWVNDKSTRSAEIVVCGFGCVCLDDESSSAEALRSLIASDLLNSL